MPERIDSMSLKEVMTMLAFDPFLRDFDRLTQQLLGSTLGTVSRPAVMPIDAWREGDDYVVELDLPGSSPTPSMSASNMRRSRYGRTSRRHGRP
ncbi:heat shock domain protein [Mycobacterium xenopi 4042]|uniref:Heat shock domain protein n=1 Tax=Mycobacterium xenopi 4042 TaxID=1299334 RepID=X8AJF4_MYCXE|nr:heat shock domain protein [Mycobacterium xenopi 4042]